jgi:putative restriction endonuclease
VHLVASHCKPWRNSTNEERLNGENGLLLTPSIDHLFDRGFIGFENNGELIISPVAHRPSLQRMGIEVTRTVTVGSFTSGQKQYPGFSPKRGPAAVKPPIAFVNRYYFPTLDGTRPKAFV